jgi:SAM-dependent methyltransferase
MNPASHEGVAPTPEALLEERFATLGLSGWNLKDARNHTTRLVRSLEFLPDGSGELLELGPGGGHFTALLERFTAYRLSQSDRDQCDIETDALPFADASHDVVLAMEVLEHLGRDPMWALWEINRVLRASGLLFLTTPNAASSSAILRALKHHNPYVFPLFRRDGATDRHNREYTFTELKALVNSAGMRVESLATMDVYAAPEQPPKALLAPYGTECRGDTIFLLARKIGAPTERYPGWLYL